MPNFSADDLHPTTVHDRDGNRVGKVQQVYLDDNSGRPSWVTVNTGLFGTNESLIPLDGAQINGDVLTVPFDKQVIKDAPNFDPGHHLDESDEQALYDYYGVGGQAHDERTPAAGGGIGGLAAGQDTGDNRGTDQRGERRTDLRSDDGRLRADPGTSAETDRSRGDEAGAAFTQAGDSRESGVGDRHRSEMQDSEQELDDHERELLERERDLLKRERELLDKDRQFLERERQQGERPRLRRHQPGQS